MVGSFIRRGTGFFVLVEGDLCEEGEWGSVVQLRVAPPVSGWVTTDWVVDFSICGGLGVT